MRRNFVASSPILFAVDATRSACRSSTIANSSNGTSKSTTRFCSTSHGKMRAIGSSYGTKRSIWTICAQSLTEEKEPDASNILQLYEEAGVALPGTVTRRLDEVQRFHEAIVENR